jgi:hypothetical protein
MQMYGVGDCWLLHDWPRRLVLLLQQRQFLSVCAALCALMNAAAEYASVTCTSTLVQHHIACRCALGALCWGG